MEGRTRPDLNATPYDIVHESVATVGDGDSVFVVVTEDGDIDRPMANDPEGLQISWYEEDTGKEVEHMLTLDTGYWDIDARDMCFLVAVERRGRKDNRGEWMGSEDGPDGGLYVVLKYLKYAEGASCGTISYPNYDLSLEYGSGLYIRLPLTDFIERATRGKRHDISKHFHHEDKSLDDIQFMRQRLFGDRSGLPP